MDTIHTVRMSMTLAMHSTRITADSSVPCEGTAHRDCDGDAVGCYILHVVHDASCHGTNAETHFSIPGTVKHDGAS